MKTRDSGSTQSHDQEESKLKSTIFANSCAHAPTDERLLKTKKIITKSNKVLTKILLLGPFRYSQWCRWLQWFLFKAG